jgi:hypothetical protein
MKLPDAAPAPPPVLIGWRETVALPDLGIPAIRAKVDTGARTSSLHAEGVELFERDGVHWARFLLVRSGSRPPTPCEAPHVEHRFVTSSSGHKEERLIVKTRLKIGDFVVAAEFGLADRSDMNFPLLVGRTALRRRFVVDPARSYLLTPRPRRRKLGAGGDPA